MSLEKKIAQLLIQHKKKVAVAESCSGGILSSQLTAVPGSSAFFIAGIVSYSNLSKTKILRISPSLLKKHGAVSAPVASLMAKNVKKLFATDFGISITGIAGPSGGTKEKPVGTTLIAVCGPKIVCEEFVFKGSRSSIRVQAAHKALELLLNFF